MFYLTEKIQQLLETIDNCKKQKIQERDIEIDDLVDNVVDLL